MFKKIYTEISEKPITCFVFLCAGIFLLRGCGPDPEVAQAALTKAGFTDAKIEATRPWHQLRECTGIRETRFTATGANGRSVQGVVCSGKFWGSPIIQLMP